MEAIELERMSFEDLNDFCKNASEYSEEDIAYAKELLSDFEKKKGAFDSMSKSDLQEITSAPYSTYSKVKQDYARKCIDRLEFGSVEESVNELLVRINRNLYESKEHLKVIKGCVIFFTVLIVIGLILGIVGVVSLSSMMSALSAPSKYLR